MKNILITGACGQLGSELQLLTNGYNKYVFTDAIAGPAALPLDICSPEEVDRIITNHDISLIINCAAYTNVENAESNIDICRKINVDGVKNIARSAKRHNAALVQISTDYVFDGLKREGAYKENDICQPLSAYGLTKYESEIAVREIGVNGIIIRTAWLYSTFGKNFVKTMLSLGREKEQINVVSDQIGSPTYARDLAKAILKIVPRAGDFQGEIFHYTDEGHCSWFEFATAIMKFGSLNCLVNPVTSKEYITKATRPSYSVLDKSKIRETFGIEIPSWKDSLRECVTELL